LTTRTYLFYGWTLFGLINIGFLSTCHFLKAKGEMMKKTIMEATKETVDKYGSQPALFFKVNNS